MDDLEKYALSCNDAIALRAVQECRIAMEKLIAKMDNLESGFDKIAERSRKLLGVLQSHLILTPFQLRSPFSISDIALSETL